jgi:hypothetical protein
MLTVFVILIFIPYMKTKSLQSIIGLDKAAGNLRCSSLVRTSLVLILLVLLQSSFSEVAIAQSSEKARLHYRGPQVAGTSMSNVHLKSSETVSPSRATFVSWKAPQSGYIREIWGWFKTDNKRRYSGGNRGTYMISIRPDLGGVPALKVLAEAANIAEFKDNDTADNLRQIVFKQPAQVAAGRIYHFVISNTDASPAENWLSLNTVFSLNDRSEISRPTNTDDRSFGFHGSGGKYESGMPTWVVGIDENNDGTSDVYSGNPYVGTFSHYGNEAPRSRPISGSRITRIAYPVPGGVKHTVKRVAVAAYRIAGRAPLSVSLVNGTGQILSTAQIQSGAYPSTSNSDRAEAMTWGAAAFNPEVSVEPSGNYYLQFQTAQDTVYFPVALQDSADSYGGPENMTGIYGGWFGLAAYAEHSVDDGASWELYSLTNSQHPSYVKPTRKWDLGFYVVTD